MQVSRWTRSLRRSTLTAGDDDPDEIHEEVVAPKVVRFWSTVCKTLMVVIKHAGSVVKDISVDLAKGNQRL